MAINPLSILKYLEDFCVKGTMQGPWPNTQVIPNSYTTDGPPKAKTDVFQSPTLTEYITAASQYYDMPEPGLKDAPPMIATVVWEVIAHNIAYNFHYSRNGKLPTEGCTPKNTSTINFVAGPPATIIATPSAPSMFAAPPLINRQGGGLARAKASIDKDKAEEIKKKIIEWFKANYEYSIKKGKEANITAQQLAEATAPDTDKQAKAVSKAFNDYFKKSTYSAKPGIPLPPALVPKSTDQEYFPDMAPHKDTDGNSEGPPRAGSAGYCIGPFYRKVILEDASGTCKVKDGSITQKSPKFKLSEAPIDDVEFFIDDEAGNRETPPGRLRNYLGTSYNAFVRGRSKEFEGPSGLPVNGGQEIIINYKDPDTGEDKSINTRVRGLNTAGTRTPGNPAKNENYGNPIPPEELITLEYGAPEIDSGLEIQNWVRDDNGIKHVLGVQFNNTDDKNKAWGGPGNNKRYSKDESEDPVLSYMSNARAALETPAPDTGEEGLSQADPRTWGPWTEYAKESDVVRGDDFALLSRRFKHLVPDKAAFDAALAAPVNESFNAIPGVKINGAPCLPALNKSYWGYRLREVFDETKGNPASQAQSAGSSPQPNSAGVIWDNLKGIAGPVPPLQIKEAGSSCNFEWSNATVLMKAGKVGPNDGTPFKRTDTNHPSNHSMYHTIADHFMGSKGVEKTIDANVKGSIQGGMVYFDATKQIIAPYAPPPALKPFMPNTAKGNW
jgi:hypothetical protein